MGFFSKLEDALKNPTTWLTAAVMTVFAGPIGGLKAFAMATAKTAAAIATMTALSPSPKLPSIDNTRRLTNRSPNASRKLLYGKVRTGGTIIFMESTDDNQYLHMVILMAPHEIQNFEAVYFNDDELTIAGTNVTSPARYNNKVYIQLIGKGTSSNIPTQLVSDTSWTSNHVLTDQAYIYLRLEFDAEAFPQGIPNVTAEMSGRKVLDTRSDTTIYSNNPAMIIRNYLTDSVYGLGATADEIDDTTFEAAANDCDDTIVLSGGGSEKRYTCNGIVDTANTPRANLENLLTSMAGQLYYSNGQWRLRAGVYQTPTVTLDEDDLASGITIHTAISRRDSFNAVKGQFYSEANGYVVADFPSLTSTTFENEDNGERRFMNIDLPYTTSSSMAQRIAKLMLYRNRQEVTISASFKLTAFQFEVGDTLFLTNERMGFDQKPFEVASWRLNFGSDQVVVDCVLIETSSNVYDWNAEEVDFQFDNTTLPSAVAPPAPTNLTLTATAVVNDDGITIPAIRADWDVVNAGFVQYYEIQFKRLGGEEDYGSITVSHTETENWGSIATAYTDEEDYGLTSEPILSPDAQYQSVIGTSNSFTIIPVLNGYDYNVRVRSINTFGVRSAFVSSTLASAGDTIPPSVPTNLAASPLYKAIDIRWTNPADQDLDYVEIWENTTDNLTTASLIGTSGSNNYIRANLANNVTRYYWVRAVDLSLNKSDYTNSVNETTLLIEPNDFNDAVNDLFTEAGAFGIEPVSSLPASGAFDGQIVLLKTDLTLYRWDSATSSWDTELYTASSLTAGSITLPNFASGIEPIGIVSTLPTPSGYTGAQVVFLTTDSKLYRYTGTAWTAATSTQDLSGELGAGLFSDDLRPVERVTSLPVTDLTQGRVVMLTTDNKLYRYNGTAWTSDIAASDVTGQLNGSQISDGAITTTKITDDAITAPKVAANAIEADSIAANAITAGKIATGAVSADKIAANAVTAAKLAADSVEAGKIAAGAISTSSLFVDGVIQSDAIATGAIVTNKIAASAIISSKIGAGAVTADKISVSELSAIAADLGTIEVDTANIANSAVTSAKIADANITSAKIANAAVGTAQIGNLSVSRLKIANGAVSNTAAGSYSSTVSINNTTLTDTLVRSIFTLDANISATVAIYWQKTGRLVSGPSGDATGYVYWGTSSGNPFANTASYIEPFATTSGNTSVAIFTIASSGSARTIYVACKAEGNRTGANTLGGEYTSQTLTSVVFMK